MYSMIPKQMKTALKKHNDKYAAMSDEQLDALARAMPLSELKKIKGVGDSLIRRYAKNTGREGELPSIPITADANLDAMRDAFLRDLLSEYEPESPNDRENIEQLASLYAIRRRFTARLMALMDLDRQQNEADEQARARLVTDRDKLERAITTLEKHLEIDRSAREQASSKLSAPDIIQEFTSQALDYLADEMVVHSTNHGPVGITLWDIHDERYVPKCSKCGSDELAYVSPWDGTVHPFRVVTNKALEEYVRASDFVPKDAPSGLGVFDRASEILADEEKTTVH